MLATLLNTGSKQITNLTFQVATSFYMTSMAPLLGLFLLGGLFPWANWIVCHIFSKTAMASVPLLSQDLDTYRKSLRLMESTEA